jgi:hypothetical protein
MVYCFAILYFAAESQGFVLVVLFPIALSELEQRLLCTTFITVLGV